MMRAFIPVLLATCALAPFAIAQTAPTTQTTVIVPTETAGAVAVPPAPEMESRDVAVLQVLDKISARVTTLRVPVNMQATFGQLVMTPRACRVNPPSAAPEAVAFLEVGEIDINSVARSAGSKASAPGQKLIYSGWMFASTPALSALEHPIYDVMVLKCETRKQAKEAANKPEPEAPEPAKPATTPPPADEAVPLD